MHPAVKEMIDAAHVRVVEADVDDIDDLVAQDPICKCNFENMVGELGSLADEVAKARHPYHGSLINRRTSSQNRKRTKQKLKTSQPN